MRKNIWSKDLQKVHENVNNSWVWKTRNSFSFFFSIYSHFSLMNCIMFTMATAYTVTKFWKIFLSWSILSALNLYKSNTLKTSGSRPLAIKLIAFLLFHPFLFCFPFSFSSPTLLPSLSGAESMICSCESCHNYFSIFSTKNSHCQSCLCNTKTHKHLQACCYCFLSKTKMNLS